MFTNTPNQIGAALIAAVRPSSHRAQIFPQKLIDFAAEIDRSFLSDDYSARSRFSVACGIPELICGASASQAQRQKIAQTWLADALESAAAQDPLVQDWLAQLPEEKRCEMSAGKFSLQQIDAEIAEYQENLRRRIVELRNQSKENLRRAMSATMLDVDDADIAVNYVPAAVVICENGASGIFRRRHAAVEFGRASGGRFFMIQTDRQSAGFHVSDDVVLMEALGKSAADADTAAVPSSPVDTHFSLSEISP